MPADAPVTAAPVRDGLPVWNLAGCGTGAGGALEPVASREQARLPAACGARSEGRWHTPVCPSVDAFDPGSPASLSAYDIDFVVTEFGVADLRGKNPLARSECLIQVAAPAFQEELATALL